jgi:hypothetical protein
MNSIKTIEKKISKLPPGLIIKLDDYVDYLLSQNHLNIQANKLKQTWAGGLKDYKNKYSSLELQKLALEWRAD